MYALGVAEEKQAQFEKDAAVFNSLNPRQQRTAVSFAKIGYGCRQGLVAVNKAVMVGADWLFNILVTVPCNAAKPFVMKAWNGLAKRFKFGAYKNPDSKINKRWLAIKEKFSVAVKKAGEFLEYYGAISLYRATKWILNPRRRSGKPLFGSEVVNKIIGTVAGICSFVCMTAGLIWIEVMAKVWHAQIAQSALTDTAPRLIRLGKQAVLHPALSGVLAAAQFLIIPPIAAARQALKSTKIVQGIAYQFNSKVRAGRAGREQKAATGWKPSAYVKKFFDEILEKTSPEFYIARLKYFRAQRKKKQAGEASSPVTPPDAVPAGNLGGLDLGKTFNEKAPDSPAPETVKKGPPALTPPAP
jgi:hypothetical protein